jgi:hypothetical protein
MSLSSMPETHFTARGRVFGTALLPGLGVAARHFLSPSITRLQAATFHHPCLQGEYQRRSFPPSSPIHPRRAGLSLLVLSALSRCPRPPYGEQGVGFYLHHTISTSGFPLPSASWVVELCLRKDTPRQFPAGYPLQHPSSPLFTAERRSSQLYHPHSTPHRLLVHPHSSRSFLQPASLLNTTRPASSLVCAFVGASLDFASYGAFLDTSSIGRSSNRRDSIPWLHKAISNLKGCRRDEETPPSFPGEPSLLRTFPPPPRFYLCPVSAAPIETHYCRSPAIVSSCGLPGSIKWVECRR